MPGFFVVLVNPLLATALGPLDRRSEARHLQGGAAKQQPFEAGSLACADLDLDGDLDLAATSTQQLLVLVNDGLGTFAAAVT